eukprot:6201372-Pleurochrysis_carterae.AAC.3
MLKCVRVPPCQVRVMNALHHSQDHQLVGPHLQADVSALCPAMPMCSCQYQSHSAGWSASPRVLSPSRSLASRFVARRAAAAARAATPSATNNASADLDWCM